MKTGTKNLKTGIYSNMVVFGLFIIITLVIYGNSLNSPFLFDDDGVVVKNLNVQDIKNIPYFFIKPHLSAYNPAQEGHYRPIVYVSYAINFAIGKLDPFGYHLVNMMIHAGSAFLVFLILKAMLGGVSPRNPLFDLNSLPGLAAGIIFLAHPFNSEAVNYITARSSLLSGFFYLLAFWCWVKYREGALHPGRYYRAAIIVYVIGMLSKEILVTLPFVFWLYDMCIYYSGHGEIKSIGSNRNSKNTFWSFVFDWRTYISYLPFIFIVIIPYILIRLFAYKKIVGGFQRDIFTQLMTEAPVLVKHWQMFFVPKGLSLFHDVDIYHGMTLVISFSLILLLLYLAAAIYLVRLKELFWKIIAFFMLWFFIVLLPTTIIPLNMIFQENRGYLAIVSFAAIIGVVLVEISKKFGKILLIVSVLLIVLVYSVVTIQRNTVWQDNLSLWKDSVKNAPLSGVAYAGLAAAYRDRGDIFLSIETAKKGIAVEPNNYSLRINLGRSYQLAGETDKAIKEYEEALRLEPKQAVIWNELATLYSKKGDLAHTEIYLKEGIKRWKDLSPLHYNLAVVHAAQGKLREAEAEFYKAIELFPAYVRARFELAELFEKTGRYDEANYQYREIVKYNAPDLLNETLQFGQGKSTVEKIIRLAIGRLEGKAEGRSKKAEVRSKRTEVEINNRGNR